MASTTFVDGQGRIYASWLNDINRLNYTVFGNAATPAEARSALGMGVLDNYGTAYAANAAGLAAGEFFRSGNHVRQSTGAAATRERLVNVRGFGAVLDGTTDDLAAFNAAIQSVPSGSGVEIVVDGPAYLSAATTNSGRYPKFIFTNGGGICSTSGGALGSESSRLSWPVRFERQLPNGYVYDYGTTPPSGGASVRHRYTNMSGNATVLGTTNAYGIRQDYKSWAYGSGFDIAEATLGIWNRSAGQDGGQMLAQWLVAVTPKVGSAAARWGTFAAEFNVANRHADHGWSAKRSPLDNWCGVLQLVAENDEFEAVGTATYDALYHLVTGPSSANKSTDGKPARAWNSWLMEPNAVVGDGYGIYASGNDTGVSADDPAAFLGLAQTWKTGIDTSAATLTTGRALAMDDAHWLAWMDGASEVASIRAATASTAASVAAAGISNTSDEGFLQFTRPLLWTDGNYVDRNAVITLRRDVASPTSVQPMVHITALGKGDNASVKGVTGLYVYTGDRSDVDATNKGVLYGISSVVVPKVARDNIPYDDICGLVVQHGGLAGTKGTDAMFVGRNTNFLNDDPEWLTGLTIGANVSYGFRTSAATFVGMNASGRMAGVGGNGYGFLADGEAQTSVTSNAYAFRSELDIAAGATVSALYGVSASKGTWGAGATVTNQYGFHASSTMTGATNNYGFYGNLAEATGSWNFVAGGTAWNYFAGNTGIGSTSLTGRRLAISGNHTGATTAYGTLMGGTIRSDVTSAFAGHATTLTTEDAAFTLPALFHYLAQQGTITGGSRTAPTSQYGFAAQSTLTGATNNYGFHSNIASGAGRWNFYAAGTAANFFAGEMWFGTHSALAAETVTGYITIKDSAGNTRKLAVVS